MQRKSVLLIILLTLLVLPTAYAAPTTEAATDVTSRNLTFHISGATSVAWWEYGTRSDNLLWRTGNVTVGSGLANTTESGTPLMSNTLFYYRACDTTGCGNVLSVTLAAVTPAPETTFGRAATNISAAHLDPVVVGQSAVESYGWRGIPFEIVIGILLFFVFTGLWLAHRETLLPTMVGLIGSGMIVYAGTNSVGVPPEFVVVAVGLVCIGLTGVVVGIMKR